MANRTVEDKWTSPAVILVMHSDIPLMPPHWLSPNHSANVPRPGNQHPIRMVYQSAAELQSRVDRIRRRRPRTTHLHTWINPHPYACTRGRTATHKLQIYKTHSNLCNLCRPSVSVSCSAHIHSGCTRAAWRPQLIQSIITISTTVLFHLKFNSTNCHGSFFINISFQFHMWF